jgi:hypothetical protein
MGVFSKAKDALRPASKKSVDGSAASTIAPSVEPSVMEKNPNAQPDNGSHPANQVTESREESELDVKEKAEAGIEEAKLDDSADNFEDDYEYPTKMKLVLITLALCLSVFCMALVRV